MCVTATPPAGQIVAVATELLGRLNDVDIATARDRSDRETQLGDVQLARADLQIVIDGATLRIGRLDALASSAGRTAGDTDSADRSERSLACGMARWRLTGSDCTLALLDDLSAATADVWATLFDAEDRYAALRDTQVDLERSLDDDAATSLSVATLREQIGDLASGPAAGRASQLDALRARAADAALVGVAIDALFATAREPLAPTPAEEEEEPSHVGSWVWPLLGVLTQPFGPTTFPLEPAVRYRGTLYPHFHDGIDLAAPLGTPVRAAAAGVVTFVGHLPDGAMVVLIAHANRVATLYAHLADDVPSPVHAGDRVAAGQLIGAVGMTGMTTGPHLHFAARREGEPTDPLVLLE